MHYLLQSDLSTSEAQAPYVQAFERASKTCPKLTWSPFELVLFAGLIKEERDYGPRVFPFGSASVVLASQHYGWSPGVLFDDATFRFSSWVDGWGRDALVNHDAIVTTFGQASSLGDEQVFVRPDADSKAFTGGLISAGKLKQWQQQTATYESLGVTGSAVTSDLLVVVAPPKRLLNEWRLFVVADRVVAASQYAVGGAREIAPGAPDRAIRFAHGLISRWRPAECFVLDVAYTHERGFGVVEVNTFNSSGLYACDAFEIVKALEDHYE